MPTTINIKNPSSVSLNVRSDFLGENVRWRRVIEVGVEGWLLDLEASSGVGGILTGLDDASTEYLSDWDNVEVGGISLGSGKLASLSFSPSNDVRTKQYSASFEFYETGDLSSLSPNKGSLTELEFVRVSSLSESFSTSKLRDGKLECVHTAAVAIEDGGTVDALVEAKTLAQKLLSFSSFPYVDILWGEGSSSNCNSFYNESYDRINNEVSIEKKYVYDPNGGGDGYTFSVSNSFQFDGGVVTVTESAEYKTKGASAACYNSMFSALNSNLSSAFSRCESVYNAYKTNNNLNLGAASLQSNYFNRSINSSPSQGVASYSISYSNDKYYNESCFWSKTNSLSVDESGTITVSQSGEIIGAGHLGQNLKQKTADDFFNGKRSQIESEILSFYNSFKEKGGYSSSAVNLSCFIFNLDSKSVTRNNRVGKVGYNYSYSASSNKIDDPDFKKVTINCTTQAEEEIKLNTNFIIPKYREIKYISAQGNNEPSSYDSSVALVGKRDNISFDTYKNRAESDRNEACVGEFVISAKYSFSPSSNAFGASWESIDLNP